ncbi:MAG: hypothetical protein LBM78_04120, partial [Clostridiales bacterium]|nr:hypothetical protein [Clostridiales bacterium]
MKKSTITLVTLAAATGSLLAVGAGTAFAAVPDTTTNTSPRYGTHQSYDAGQMNGGTGIAQNGSYNGTLGTQGGTQSGAYNGTQSTQGITTLPGTLNDTRNTNGAGMNGNRYSYMQDGISYGYDMSGDYEDIYDAFSLVVG